MMILSMRDYPRTVTRQRWYRIWSERRRMNRTERLMASRRIDILATVPDIPPHIREDIVYKITNPVLFAWPNP